jgi:hypothetical protein
MEKNNIKKREEQLKDFPQKTTTQEIDGCKYIVHSHFVGEKDLDEVMKNIAFETALNSSLITA